MLARFKVSVVLEECGSEYLFDGTERDIGDWLYARFRAEKAKWPIEVRNHAFDALFGIAMLLRHREAA